jgi:hypothetical protein
MGRAAYDGACGVAAGGTIGFVATSCRLLVAAAAAAGAVAVTACGSGGPARPAKAATARTAKPHPRDRFSTDLPPNVPQAASGPADRRAARVIRAWLRALDRGDIESAADYFAEPSKFQNGTPVLTLDSRTERLAVNLSLSCGARAVELGSSGPFTIVTFRLVARPGADCGDGVGDRARGAIRVARGLIQEWYRLPDVPGGPMIRPPPPRIVPSGPAI